MQDLNQLQAYLRQFAKDRDWDQFHSSRNESIAHLPCAYLRNMKAREAINDDFYAEDIKKEPEAALIASASGFSDQQGMFVTRVVGESMNKRIINGSWCLFKANPGGSRNGKIVLVQHRDIENPDHGGTYTVKT